MALNNTVISCLVAALFMLTGFAVAQDTAVSADNHPRSVTMMSKVDLDQDGRISEEEHFIRCKDDSKRARFAEQFAKIDADKDGFITYPELNARFEKISPRVK
jgi:Ca2+-binding EF-hand superfamily protein